MMTSDDIILAQCSTVMTVRLKGGKQHNETKVEGYSSGREKEKDSGSTDFMHLSQRLHSFQKDLWYLGTWKVNVIPATVMSSWDNAAMRLEQLDCDD
jgi:hypothetical protein